MAKKTGKLVVVSGPSGVGKTTIVREVVRRAGVAFSVSATTRPPRQGEQSGRDYVFVDRRTFEGLAARGELLEWAEVFGQLYGTPAAPVREMTAAGKTVVLDIDVQGGLQIYDRAPDATFVLILAPTDDVLAERLRGRRSESGEALQLRLRKAQAEIDAARKSGVYTHVVVNDDLERAVAEVVDIVKQERSQND